MNKNIFIALTSSIVAVTAIGASPLKSQALTFDFTFDDTPDATVTDPIVGTGTFSFDGDIADGTFALTSLPNFNFFFIVNNGSNGSRFTNTSIRTPLADILVKIATIGSDRFVNFGSLSGGLDRGPLEFIDIPLASRDFGILIFERGFGSQYFNLNFIFKGIGVFSPIEPTRGTYQGIARADVTPVPEPGSILGLLGLSLGALVAKNKKQAQPSLSKVS
jgi:hypothetical protein